jgi:hypothetical protein
MVIMKAKRLQEGGTAKRSMMYQAVSESKLAINRVSTIKLPDGQCTQTGGQTLSYSELTFQTQHWLTSQMIGMEAELGYRTMHNEQGRLEPGHKYNQ